MNKKPLVPLGRAIIHRKSGRVVGPIAPIDPEDWPFIAVDERETLWRYMDFFKFEDLLKTSALYFSRPDSFTDPFEGRFSTGNQKGKSKSDEIFRELYRFSEDTRIDDYHEIHRNVVFISCWHRNTHETMQMWDAYTESPDSVAITTTVRALKQNLPKGILQYGVKYASLDFPRTEFSHNSLFYYKPSEYHFEREFRLLRSPDEDESFYSENPNDKFRRVEIPTRKIVHRVFTHPRAPLETRVKVNFILHEYLPSIQAQESRLTKIQS